MQKAKYIANNKFGKAIDSNVIQATANGRTRDKMGYFDVTYPYNWKFDDTADIVFALTAQGQTYTSTAKLSVMGSFSLSMDTLIDHNDTVTLHWDGDPMPGHGYMYVEIGMADGHALPGGIYNEHITNRDHVLNYDKTKTLAPGRYLVWVAREVWDLPLEAAPGSMSYMVSAYKYVTVE